MSEAELDAHEMSVLRKPRGPACARVPRLNSIRTTTTDHPSLSYTGLLAQLSIQIHGRGPASTVPSRARLPIPDNISLSARPPPLYRIKDIALARSMHAPPVNELRIVSTASLLLDEHTPSSTRGTTRGNPTLELRRYEYDLRG